MKLLDIVKQCCYRTGDNLVTNLFADEDNAREWLGYVCQAVSLIQREHNWSRLTKDYNFTTTGSKKDYALPKDFERIVSYYIYNLSNQTKIPYANNDAELDKLMSGDKSQTSIRFRIMGGNISFTYPIENNQDLVYSYISSYPVRADNGEMKEHFSSNEDTFVLSDELLILKTISLRAVNLGLPEADRRESDYLKYLELEMNNDGANVSYNLFEKGFVNKTTPDDWSVYDK